MICIPPSPSAGFGPSQPPLSEPWAEAPAEAFVPRPTRIRLLDDDVSAAGGLATLLETPGAQVRRAANGAEALLHGLKPDLALLDRDKSQIDGFELAARLHATPRHRAACPVAVTGCGPLTTSVRLRSAGFDRCTIKPIVEHEVHLMELGARGGR